MRPRPMTMVCDVCNKRHGSKIHGHGSPPEDTVFVHADRVASHDQICRCQSKKNVFHDDINGAASIQRQCRWTSFEEVAPGDKYCVACNSDVPPIRNTTGLEKVTQMKIQSHSGAFSSFAPVLTCSPDIFLHDISARDETSRFT